MPNIKAITNPRKKFNFRVEFPLIPSLGAFHVQKITTSDLDVDMVEHGFGNTDLKTAGKAKVGTVKLERILPASQPFDVGNVFVEWQKLAQDPVAQAGGDPELYKRALVVYELANDGSTVINTWYIIGAWPTKISGRDLDRTVSENTIEAVELAVDYVSLDLPI